MSKTTKPVVNSIPLFPLSKICNCDLEQDLLNYTGSSVTGLLKGLVRQCKQTKNHKDQSEWCIGFGIAVSYFRKAGKINLDEYHKYARIYENLCNYGQNKESPKTRVEITTPLSQPGTPAYSN